MHKLVARVGGLVAAGVVVVGLALAPSAAADTPANPGCGAALLALTAADKAAADATAADKAAADAKKADDALADANTAVDTARAAAVNGGLSSADLTAAKAQALRDDKAAIEAIPAAQRTPAQVDQLIKDTAQLPLVEAFLDAQTKAAAAKVVADRTDAEALRRAADATDAAALIDAAGKAGDAADVACGRNTGVHFDSCDDVRAAGKAPLRSTDPGYRLRLDTDRDGLACELVEGSAPAPARRLPAAVDTGYAA